MDKNEIISILNDWNIWKNDFDTGTYRKDYVTELNKLINTNHVITITGARRSGKSYIMKQLIKTLINKGVNKKDILLVNFDDSRFTDLTPALLNKIYKTYIEFLSPGKKPFVFLDEIQEVQDWERWVRTMNELKKAKIIVSGSNAQLLSKELGTLLTGRHLDLEVYPLSFREFLNFNNIEIKDNLDRIKNEVQINRFLRHYMNTGAFPETIFTSEKNHLLIKYFEDIITKDIIRRFKIRKPDMLKSLLKYYLSNISTLTTFNASERFLKISADTIEKFSGYFKQAYLMFFLKRFSYKVKEQEKSPRKVYAIDVGLANTIGFKVIENYGQIIENIVFLELKRRQAKNQNIDLFYWKDQYHKEVDFLIRKGLEVTGLIQVCWDILNEKTRQRELHSLHKAMAEFKLKEGLVITNDYKGEEKNSNTTIRFVPLKDWLLEKQQI